MFNKIKGFFKNIVNNIKYVLHGIKKVFTKTEETVQKVATGEDINYDMLEVAVNGTLVVAGVASILLCCKVLLAAKTFNLVYAAVTFASAWCVTRFLMSYGARDFAPEGSNICDNKEKANAE